MVNKEVSRTHLAAGGASGADSADAGKLGIGHVAQMIHGHLATGKEKGKKRKGAGKAAKEKI